MPTDESQKRHSDKIKVERELTRQTGLTRTQIRDGLRTFAKDVQAQQAVAAIPTTKSPDGPSQTHSVESGFQAPSRAPANVDNRDPRVELVSVTVTGSLNGVPGVGYAGYFHAPIPI